MKTKTAGSRLNRAITTIAAWCKRHRHVPLPEQQATLSRKLSGHYAYYGRPGNYHCLSQVYRGVLHAWKQWLSRRSWAGYLNWPTFWQLLARHPLPPPRIRRRDAAPSSA